MRYDLLSVQQAAVILGVSRMTVYRMVEDGRLTVVAKIGASIALERAEVEDLARRPTSERERAS